MLQKYVKNNFILRRLLAENGKFCAALKVLESSQVHVPQTSVADP